MTEQRYTRGAIAFHWTIAVLIIVNLALGILHEQFAPPIRSAMLDLHKPIGILVLVLSLGRLAWRLGHRPPPLPSETPGWEIGLAHLVHWSFYALMIIMPLSGWWFSSAGKVRYPISAFGLFPIPYLPVQQGDPSGPVMHQAHVLLGWVMLTLVALHILAALRHQLLKRDLVLDRMWPGMSPR